MVFLFIILAFLFLFHVCILFHLAFTGTLTLLVKCLITFISSFFIFHSSFHPYVSSLTLLSNPLFLPIYPYYYFFFIFSTTLYLPIIHQSSLKTSYFIALIFNDFIISTSSPILYFQLSLLASLFLSFN